MNQILSLCFGAVAALALLSPAQAQTSITYAYTGQITRVDDTYNWFNDTYTIGGTVTGTLTYFDSGYTKGVVFGNPAEAIYLNNLNVPHPNHPDFSLRAGNRQVNQEGNGLSIEVINDGTDPFYNAAGDTVVVRPELDTLPSFFNDPANTPGFEDYFAGPFAFFRFYDPTGMALASTDLPFPLPRLSAFSIASGRIGITDNNGSFDEAAVMDFRFTSLQAVPEPGSVALLLGMGISGGVFAIGRRARR